ncbi:hypothetical protein [Ruegeria intermedia]|uniref:hypothetical protein n=1 Tax=Ruegeria intermedia TaxID=996115 RepID=UPI001CB6D20D|nr:hypothetical protein [Ruegeria intermedia]
MYKEMESQPQDLDEAGLAASIADIMQEERRRTPAAAIKRPEFPDLRSDEEPDPEQSAPSLVGTFRQKLAELAGAA